MAESDFADPLSILCPNNSNFSDEGDYVYQPFEPELDWSSFSVALPESEVPTMHVELGAMSAQPGRLDAMR